MSANEEFSPEEDGSKILNAYWNQATDFISSYGWYLLGITLLLAYLKPYMEDAVDKLQRSRENDKFIAKCKKNPNLLERQRQAIEKSRLKMQEEHDKKAAEHAEKMKAKEEQKRQELLSQTEMKGNKLGDGKEASSSKKNWRPEYNPLMGNGSTGYRPPRRSGCPGGGCG